MINLKISQAGDVAVVCFARPPVNAMDAGSLEELAAIFDRLAGDSAVKAAVLTAKATPSRPAWTSSLCPSSTSPASGG